MVAANLSIPSKKSKPRWKHDVFLSFRGEDTRKNFTDHLYSALVRRKICTFRDDQGLERGENISSGLLNAICGSRISIVIFSQGYASSSWCLDELVHIEHYKNVIGSTLFPIFYHVNPSDVRRQTGTFAEAFAKHERRLQLETERVQRWKAALTEAANCSGRDLQSGANGYESEFINTIVEEVYQKVASDKLSESVDFIEDVVSESVDVIEDVASESVDVIEDVASESVDAIEDVFSISVAAIEDEISEDDEVSDSDEEDSDEW